MSKQGALSKISGSGYATPKSSENEETYHSEFTVEMAVLQIQGILQLCIDENKDIISNGILGVLCEKQDFDEKFASLLEFNRDDLFTLNTLKDYVLNDIIPRISELNENTFFGKMQLCSKLTHAAQAWPTPEMKMVMSVFPEDKKKENSNKNNSLQSICELETEKSLLVIYDGSFKTKRTEAIDTKPNNKIGIIKRPTK